MSVLFGMWYARLPTYHGLQSMSVLMFFRARTASLYDFAVIAPLMFIRAMVANFASMKPICPNDWGAIFDAYFLRIWNIRAESGPTVGAISENSLLIQRWPSNAGENCPDMNVFAIGVDEPHFSVLTRFCASAAFMKAGAVSGVKSRMIPPSVPANCDIWSNCDVASVTGRWVGKTLTSTPFCLPSCTTPPSAYAEIVSGEAMEIFFTPAAMSACAAPTLL